MLNRFAPLLLIVGLVAGYAISGPPVKAQDTARRLPAGINQGDTVSLTFAHGTMSSGGYTLTCTIVGLSDSWIRCAAPENFGSSREQPWYDVSRVVKITKPER
jgi:hypothetical protein